MRSRSADHATAAAARREDIAVRRDRDMSHAGNRGEERGAETVRQHQPGVVGIARRRALATEGEQRRSGERNEKKVASEWS